MTTESIVRILTASSLAGLLGAVGLRLSFSEVVSSVRHCRLAAILVLNFIAVPALTLGIVKIIGAPRELAIGMILLAAAPFAPVVPVFARMAQADLALAAGLTAVFPVLSVVFTPLACKIALAALPGAGPVQFQFGQVLLILVATITLPLAAGVALHHAAPRWSARLLRPVEVLSEATGALSLAFVTYAEFGLIRQTPWPALLGMAVGFELSLIAGYWFGGRDRGSRQVAALGTSNRNIALAILVAVQSFTGGAVVSAVVANGLLLILLGLLHTGWWRATK